jgi:DNA-binding XRE family transcriptional regulator
MDGAAFTRWRKRLGLTKIEAGDALGVDRRTIHNLEADPRKEIPKLTRLACAAIALGLKDYDGGK